MCSKGFDERQGLIFSQKVNHCFWEGKHDLIYHCKGIPVNTILLSPYYQRHSMADARRNLLNTSLSALNIPFESELASKRNIQL